MDLAGLVGPFDPAQFQWSFFSGGFALTGPGQVGWQSYCDLNLETEKVFFKKHAGPTIHYVISNGRRRITDVSHITALCIDIDEGCNDWEVVQGLLDRARAEGITYLCQRRPEGNSWKVHVVFPLCKPYKIVEASRVRRTTIQFLQSLIKTEIDPAPCGVHSLLYCMAKRVGKSDPETFIFTGPNAFNYEALLPLWQQRPVAKRASRDLTPEESDFVLKHFDVHGFDEGKAAWDISCPAGHEHDPSKKTLFYPAGFIVCMAGRCFGKPLAWFLKHLDDDILGSAPSSVRLNEPADRHTVSDAHNQMRRVFVQCRPTERHASVIKVTTGAGKTHAVSEFLNDYSEPIEGMEGRTSVLGVPTNSLLREVERRITIPYQKRTGVLAVLNDDGSPACKKFEVAKALQESGGNVHRLLCSRCEFQDGCPARLGASIGKGPLTVTNHALLPGVAKGLHDAGRNPFLVWDESPQWVQQAIIPVEDVLWLNQELDKVSDPTDLFVAMMDGPLFPKKRLTAVKPVMELVKWLFLHPDFAGVAISDKIEEWSRIPYHRDLLEKAQEVSSLPDLKDISRWVPQGNETGMAFDEFRQDQQKRILKAEKIIRNLAVTTATGGWAMKRDGHLFVGSLTDNAAMFRNYGGVVLDATADVLALKALRPDLKVTEIPVADSDGVQRYMHAVKGLGRKSTKTRPERLVECVTHARSVLRRLECTKPVAFGYRFALPWIEAAWPGVEVAYFGNVRGYDRYFQEGFDSFVSFGEPIANLQALGLQWKVLTGRDPDDADMEWRRFVEATAETELAQAHGRARDPQAAKAIRVHLHYGRIVPAGWDSGSTALDQLTFADMDEE